MNYPSVGPNHTWNVAADRMIQVSNASTSPALADIGYPGNGRTILQQWNDGGCGE